MKLTAKQIYPGYYNVFREDGMPIATITAVGNKGQYAYLYGGSQRLSRKFDSAKLALKALSAHVAGLQKNTVCQIPSSNPDQKFIDFMNRVRAHGGVPTVEE